MFGDKYVSEKEGVATIVCELAWSFQLGSDGVRQKIRLLHCLSENKVTIGTTKISTIPISQPRSPRVLMLGQELDALLEVCGGGHSSVASICRQIHEHFHLVVSLPPKFSFKCKFAFPL